MKTKFICNIDLKDINSSMEMDSGQTIATYEKGDYLAELRVVGDVRVLYKDEIYKHASDFPEELLKLFHEGKAYEAEVNGELEIGANNWFETFLYKKGKDGQWVWTGWSDVTDDEGSTRKEIRDGLKEYISEYIKNNGQFEVVIEELDDEGEVVDSNTVSVHQDYEEALKSARKVKLSAPNTQVAIWTWDEEKDNVVDSDIIKSFGQ